MAALVGADDQLIMLRCTAALLNADVPIERSVNIHLYRFDLRERVQMMRSGSVEDCERLKNNVSRILKDSSLKSEHFDDDAVTIAAVMHVLDPDNNPLELLSMDSFVCAVCKSTTNLLTCTKCKSERYCSKACQRQDWRRHKPYCRPIVA